MPTDSLMTLSKPSGSKSKNSSKQNTPHLPKDFLQQLLKERAMEGMRSMVFTDYMRQVRLDIVSAHKEVPLAPDSIVPPGADQSQGRTLLHFATLKTDHLLVFEMIRLGVSVDKTDARGGTALSMAFDLWKEAAARTLPPGFEQHPEAFYLRLRHIIYALIEQHADVNMVINGQTYLHRACRLGDWGLIIKLLEYRANPYPSQVGSRNVRYPSSFLPPDDRPYFRTLVHDYTRQECPPRKCPCWSGKPLRKCHAKTKDTSYPTHFRCICGSGKSYGSCSCSRRNNPVVEHYHEMDDRIVARFNRDVPFDPALIGDLRYSDDWVSEGIMKSMGIMMVLLDVERPSTSECDARYAESMKQVRELADELVQKGKVDPAFAYALHQVNFHPRPQGRTLDKRYLKMRQASWNSAVDEYIASGIDKRPRSEIERAAKVGSSLGALHRMCDNPACSKLEGRDCMTLRVCSHCKIKAFCSRECQLKIWPDHKEECGVNAVREQVLASQYHLFEGARPVVAAKFTELFSKLDPTKEYREFDQLQRTVGHFTKSEALPQDLLEMADRCRDGLLALKNHQIPLGDLHHMPS